MSESVSVESTHHQEVKKALSFEAFARPLDEKDIPVRRKRYNNLIYFFDDGFMGTFYRSSPYFQRLQKERADLVKKLTEGITPLVKKAKGAGKEIELFERDLYDAYLTMLGYGAKDEDLLK